ncbi:MAG: hypothetical protein IPM54_02345 [Polyangiaceae bacterium]|nr:hypothetical protein [Polyangiaceae bacterium]
MSLFGLGKRSSTSVPQVGNCPNMNKCALFPRFSLETALKIWQSYYCNRNYTSCERYKKMKAGQTVPDNLLPDGRFMS